MMRYFPPKGTATGPMFGEGLETFALPTRQHHGENVRHCGELLSRTLMK